MKVGAPALAPDAVALVLAGGEAPLPHLRAALVKDVALVIAADGGLEHASALGVEPDLLVGDLDSVTPAALARYPNLTISRHPRRKDQLDLEIALAVAGERGARRIRVLGAFGDRLDQSLAALFVAAKLTDGGSSISLHAGADEARVVVAGAVAEASVPLGTPLSLLALSGDALVTLAGVEYPLARAALPFGSGLGVSNEVTVPPARLTVHSGAVALLLRHLPPTAGA